MQPFNLSSLAFAEDFSRHTITENVKTLYHSSVRHLKPVEFRQKEHLLTCSLHNVADMFIPFKIKKKANL